MSNMYIQTDEGEYKITNSEMISHLEENGYLVLGDGVNSLDITDSKLLHEVLQKFLVTDCFLRENIWKQIVKGEKHFKD